MQLFILLFLLLALATMVTAVAGCHSDRDKDHRPRKNCTAAGFDDIPVGLEPSTKVLLFPNNLFSSLTWSSFQIFPEIYEIDLTGNKVPQVTPSTSPILPSLSVLRLGSNRLTSLSDGSFSACPVLTELYLDSNEIVSLSDHTFSGLSKLEILDLSSNQIKMLPELLLHPLPAIETLLLEKNKITVMPDDWFSQKEEVLYLYLSHNPWACSCPLDYLRRYLEDNEMNIYTRDGPLINNNAYSVVCDSPPWHRQAPVLSLQQPDLCSATSPALPMISAAHRTAAPVTAVPAVMIVSSAPPPPAVSVVPTSAAAPAFSEEPPAVVTRSWYHSFTKLIEKSEFSVSAATSVAPLVEPLTIPAAPTVRPLTTTPATKTATMQTRAATTCKSAPSTISLTSGPVQAVTTVTTLPSWVVNKVGNQQRDRTHAARGAGVLCSWLLGGCLLLCVASAACILATLACLIRYRTVYHVLVRRAGGDEGVRQEVAGGVKALYRSVLFIHREGEAMEGTDDRGGEGGAERVLVTPEPAGGEAETREQGRQGRGGENRGVYRKTLYRLISKEEAVEGWRDVMEECRVSSEVGGGRDEGVDRERSRGEVSRKNYSIILREEREEAGGGREELDWIVGGWEVKRGGGEEPRSSWGEWLAHYLPSMPWGVTTPPEGEAGL